MEEERSIMCDADNKNKDANDAVMSDDDGYNVYGSKISDVRKIKELEKTIDDLYKEIGLLYYALHRDKKFLLISRE